MAGHGPPPKEHRSRTRDDPELQEIPDKGMQAGFPLPEGVLPDGEAWHPQTVAWWESLRRFPLLQAEPDVGWQFLLDTALMHHTMWARGRWEFASEVRLRVAKFGATPEDRMRLKVRIVVPGEQQPSGGSSAKVSDLASRRARLTG